MPNHLIAGDVDLYHELIMSGANIISTTPGFKEIDALFGVVGTLGLSEIISKTKDKNLKDHLLLSMVNSSTNSSYISKAIAILNSYFEYKGVFNFFEDGDIVVHLSSQLAGLSTSGYNRTIFKNDKILDAFHIGIYNRLDVGNRVRDLLNSPVNSDLFGKEIYANNTIRSSSTAEEHNWDINSFSKNVERIFDKSHIEIISPSANSQFKVNDEIEIALHLKETKNLLFLSYYFQDNNDIFIDESPKQLLNFKASPDFIGEQTVTVNAVYDIGEKTVQYIDTLTVNIITDEEIIKFSASPTLVNIFENQRHYPDLTSVYQTIVSSVPTSSNKLSIIIDDPKVVEFNKTFNCFIGLSEETSFASIEYEGHRDTIYFNITSVNNENNDPITYNEIIPFSFESENSITALIYPNPVSNDIYINYSLTSATDNITIEIFNLAGQLVKNWNLGKKDIGEHKFSENIADLTKGFYLIVIRSENGRQTSKIIKL